MAKLRKMLGSADSPYIVSLMRLIETQSTVTLATWGMDYAKAHILPIYKKDYPNDNRLANALNAAQDYLDGKIKLPIAKKIIKEVQVAAKEAEASPASQAAARAVGAAAGIIYTPTHSLAVAFYGSAAIAYDEVGINESADTYDQLAANECTKMETALREIAVKDEKNPAKINWNC